MLCLSHDWDIVVLTQVAVEPSQNTVLSNACKVTKPPSDPSSVVGIGKRIRHIRPRGDGHQTDGRSDLKIDSVWGKLNRIVLIPMSNRKRGNPSPEGKQTRFMSRIQHGIERAFFKRPQRIVGNGQSL